jgi:hypothetical protein
MRAQRRAPGITKLAAGIEATQIGVGQAAAPWVMAFERAGLQAAGVINQLSPQLSALAKIVSKAVDAFGKLVDAIPWPLRK